MRKTSIPNKLSRKGCAKKIKKIMTADLKYFVVKGLNLEASRRTVTQPIAMIVATQILHSIEVIAL